MNLKLHVTTYLVIASHLMTLAMPKSIRKNDERTSLRAQRSNPEMLFKTKISGWPREQSATRDDESSKKLKLNIILSLCIPIFLSMTLSGCISRKYVEQKQYLLSSTPPTKQLIHKKNTPVYFNRVTANAPFDQLNFLYRLNEYQYVTDYYNGFLIPPTQQIETILSKQLKKASNFNINNNALIANYNLTAQINELYADYRDRAKPQAIISLKIIVLKNSVSIYDKTLTQTVPISTKNTISLLNAWNTGLQNILANVTKDLNKCIR